MIEWRQRPATRAEFNAVFPARLSLLSRPGLSTALSSLFVCFFGAILVYFAVLGARVVPSMILGLIALAVGGGGLWLLWHGVRILEPLVRRQPPPFDPADLTRVRAQVAEFHIVAAWRGEVVEDVASLLMRLDSGSLVYLYSQIAEDLLEWSEGASVRFTMGSDVTLVRLQEWIAKVASRGQRVEIGSFEIPDAELQGDSSIWFDQEFVELELSDLSRAVQASLGIASGGP